MIHPAGGGTRTSIFPLNYFCTGRATAEGRRLIRDNRCDPWLKTDRLYCGISIDRAERKIRQAGTPAATPDSNVEAVILTRLPTLNPRLSTRSSRLSARTLVGSRLQEIELLPHVGELVENRGLKIGRATSRSDG